MLVLPKVCFFFFQLHSRRGRSWYWFWCGYGSPFFCLHKEKVMVLVVLAGFKGRGCGRSVGVRRSEGPNADLALREVMETEVEKNQKISCRVLQDRKEGSASELHDDLEKVPFPEDVVKKLLGTGKAAMVMEFHGALQLPCAVILLALSVDVNVWLAYSRRSGGGCSGKGHTAENHGRSRRVIQERPVHRQESQIPLFVAFFWGVFRYVGRGAKVASERHRPSQDSGFCLRGSHRTHLPDQVAMDCIGANNLACGHRMSMHLRWEEPSSRVLRSLAPARVDFPHDCMCWFISHSTGSAPTTSWASSVSPRTPTGGIARCFLRGFSLVFSCFEGCLCFRGSLFSYVFWAVFS